MNIELEKGSEPSNQGGAAKHNILIPLFEFSGGDEGI
jgi:hypothetical protein